MCRASANFILCTVLCSVNVVFIFNSSPTVNGLSFREDATREFQKFHVFTFVHANNSEKCCAHLYIPFDSYFYDYFKLQIFDSCTKKMSGERSCNLRQKCNWKVAGSRIRRGDFFLKRASPTRAYQGE